MIFIKQLIIGIFVPNKKFVWHLLGTWFLYKAGSPFKKIMMGGKIRKKIEIGFVEERITNANDFFKAAMMVYMVSRQIYSTHKCWRYFYNQKRANVK